MQTKQTNLAGKLAYYAGWIVRCKFGGARIPLTSTLILTDHCNLHCRHCTVAHLGYQKRLIADVFRDVEQLYDAGARMLVVTGGEPFVWRDGDYGLEDVVDFAREKGFFRTVICTNGSFPLDSSADYLWVSLDGMPKEHGAVRGEGVFELVVDNIEASSHPRIFVNLVVSQVNQAELEVATDSILALNNVNAILYHVFTPYLGSDPSLLLNEQQRRDVVDRLARIKRRHPFRVSNTFAGLRELRRNKWPRPIWSSMVVNQGDLSPCCCRHGIYDENVCRQCGCTPAIETYVLERLRPIAILENLRHL